MGPYIEHCSVLFFPTTYPCTEIRITGVYIPLSQEHSVTIDRLLRLVAPTRGVSTKDVAPQLLGGDFNTAEWSSLFYEWTQDPGMQGLVDPDVPTYAMGLSLDKFLFAPGHHIPSAFLPLADACLSGGGGLVEERHYPAAVMDYPHLRDHSPILAPIPTDSRDGEQPAAKRLRVGHLTKEERGERD